MVSKNTEDSMDGTSITEAQKISNRIKEKQRLSHSMKFRRAQDDWEFILFYYSLTKNVMKDGYVVIGRPSLIVCVK